MLFFKNKNTEEQRKCLKGQVHYLDPEGKELNKIPIVALPFKDSVIIEKSKEMFNDEDPCIIHRTYSANAIGINLLEKISKMYPNELELSFKVNEIPQFISELIDIPQDVFVLKFI